MPTYFSEPVPGGSVSGTRAVERQAEGLIVEYALESAGNETVTVRLLDRLPTEDAAEFGFHEEHEPADWRVADGELVVDATLEPDSERTYVLGMVASNGEKLSCGTAAPDLEVVDADSSAADDAGFFDRATQSLLKGDDRRRDERERETADTDAGDAGSGPGLNLNDEMDSEASAGPSLQPGAPDTDDSTDRTDSEAVELEGAATNAGRKRVDADGGVVNPEPESGGVASALIAELESGTVSESQQARLKEHLGVDRSEPESVRLEYVQKRLADFDAYVDALEDLLSVHGSGDDAITEFDERLERIEGFGDDVEAIRRRQDEMAERLDDLSESLDAQAETIESLQVAHEEDIDDVRTEIRRHAEVTSEEFDALQESLDADLAALEAEIEAFESIRRTLVDGLQRPDDTAPGTTVEDATLDALDGTEEIPIVEPSVIGRDDPDAGADTTDDSEGGSEDELSATDANLEESLEAAEASNFSVSESSETDDEGPDADEESDSQHSDDEFVLPDSASTEDGWDDASHTDSSDGDDDQDAEVSGIDFEDVPDEDEIVPEMDEPESDPTAERVGEVPIGDSDADAEDDTDAENDGDEADDAGRRASSIFEIGDVDTEKSSEEEKPTIDFEDS